MFDIEQLISGGGLILITLIVFAESGLLIGFFLPGDTLLFGAGLAASQGKLPLILLIISTALAAIIGDNVGYSIGRRAGPRLFKQKDGLLFRSEYLEQAEKFYESHGGKTIVLARFTPIIRTFAPVVAGAGKMDRRRFTIYNIFGGLLWTISMTLLGYFIGSKIPHLDKYIELVLLGVVVLSIGLAVFHILKDKQSRKILMDRIKKSLKRR